MSDQLNSEDLIESVRTLKSKRPICIICEEKEAEFYIKGIPKDCYCYDCAIESFGSVDVLEKME